MLGVRIVYGFGKYSLSERGRSCDLCDRKSHKYYYAPKELANNL